MPQIDTAPAAGMFRTDASRTAPQRVDRQGNVIYGASIMQAGSLNEGDARPWTADMQTLQQVVDFGQSSRGGIKARFTHPNMSNDGMGSYLGRWANFRLDGGTVRADLHIADAAFTSPQGDLGTYVLDMAEQDPEAFGVSIATALDEANLQQWQDTLPDMAPADRKAARWPMRFTRLRAADVVDTPAATRTGLFSLADADLRNLPAQATALLDTYFTDATPDVVRARIAGFLDRYFSSKGAPMATETQAAEVVNSETPAPVQPAADLSAVEVQPEVVETATADLAQVERLRCKQIRALCDLAGAGDKFNAFVDAGFSVEQTQAALSALVVARNPVLAASVTPQESDPHSGLRAEFADLQKRGMTFGMTEEEYVKHANKA
jgi:hypothetical protein